MTDHKLIITTDDKTDSDSSRNMLPSMASVAKSLHVDEDKLASNFADALNSMYHILDKAELQSSNMEVKEVKFTFNVSSSGEVSLLSVAKGNMGGGMGIEVTIVRQETT